MTLLVAPMAALSLLVPHRALPHTAPLAHMSSPPLASRIQTSLVAGALATMLANAPLLPAAALVAQPAQVPLTVKEYQEIDCPEYLRQGRAGGALGAGAGGAGIAQKCVEATAYASNNSGKTIKDAGVFGVIIDDQGMSVLGNGQDGKNDAGQLTMIDTIPPGESIIKFLFVSQQSTDCRPTRAKKCPSNMPDEVLVPLKFEKMKAINYPGASVFKFYDECEQNEFAEGC